MIRRLLQGFIVLLFPLVLPFVLGAAGWIAGRVGWPRTRTWLLASSVVIAYLVGIVPIGDALLQPLEKAYSPVRDDALPRVDFVVVLGSGYVPGNGRPVTAALDETGLVRIVEAVRLLRKLGTARLIVSGGAPDGHARPADGYARLARELGVPDESLLILGRGLNTAQEARAVSAQLGNSPFLLVTSAAHMPRAMLEMSRAGAHPIAAPTGQLTGRPWDAGSWLPSSSGVGRCERALHEYFGLAAIWAHVSG